jgi:hypothetical protein
MDHWITGISTHCSPSESATIHWLTAICACGQVFTETSPSTSYRTAATRLAQKTTKHVFTQNPPGGPYDQEKVPRVQDA